MNYQTLHRIPILEFFLYADDAKIYRRITCVEDSQCLQRVIDKVKQWCDEWLLNATLCHSLLRLI